VQRQGLSTRKQVNSFGMIATSEACTDGLLFVNIENCQSGFACCVKSTICASAVALRSRVDGQLQSTWCCLNGGAGQPQPELRAANDVCGPSTR